MTDYIEIFSRPKPTAIQRLARDAKKIELSPKVIYSDGNGLPDCETVQDVREWLCRGYDKFHEKVVTGSQQFRLSDETREKSLALLLDPAATSIFTLNDRDLMLQAFDIMLPQFISFVQSDPHNEVISVACRIFLNRDILDLSNMIEVASSTETVPVGMTVGHHVSNVSIALHV